mmetsp:Transcript_21055/g.53374  ORF Transcript_21055/g.53374 Transcript_21055/m.53374 type:complete len:251 (+) Transcript_21055:455-1207(+)
MFFSALARQHRAFIVLHGESDLRPAVRSRERVCHRVRRAAGFPQRRGAGRKQPAPHPFPNKARLLQDAAARLVVLGVQGFYALRVKIIKSKCHHCARHGCAEPLAHARAADPVASLKGVGVEPSKVDGPYQAVALEHVECINLAAQMVGEGLDQPLELPLCRRVLRRGPRQEWAQVIERLAHRGGDLAGVIHARSAELELAAVVESGHYAARARGLVFTHAAVALGPSRETALQQGVLGVQACATVTVSS